MNDTKPSDTPRTDAAMFHCDEDTGKPEMHVRVDFARDLERELAACREQLRLANQDADRLAVNLAERLAGLPGHLDCACEYCRSLEAHRARVEAAKEKQ